MPPNLRDVTFPKGHQPTRFVPPYSSPSSSTTLPTTTTTAPSPPAPKRAPGPADFTDETLPAAERVSALCPELGLQPPTYRLERSIPGVERYYDGYPDFGHENASMPEGLGRVRKVEGREGTRARGRGSRSWRSSTSWLSIGRGRACLRSFRCRMRGRRSERWMDGQGEMRGGNACIISSS